MGWYYVETPERNRPIEAVLKPCHGKAHGRKF